MKLALIALTALALAAGSSAALAAKKHHGGGGPETDPRMAVVSKGSQSWCNLSSACNGWDKYFDGMRNHKKYAPPSMVIPTL
jgi:hypothetical protein